MSVSRRDIVGSMRLLAGRYIGARRTSRELRTRLQATDSDRVQRTLERSAAGADERMAALEAIITAIAVEASRQSLLKAPPLLERVPQITGDEPATRGAWHPPDAEVGVA